MVMRGSTSEPNIVIVMADQVVPFLTSPYGDVVAKTPAMRRLADQGVRFDAAYTAAPLCAPSRAALLTGKYPSGIGCFDNASVFPADQPTLAHYLSALGYDTVASGKMHFVGPDQLHGLSRRLTTDVFPAGVDWVPELDEHGRFPAGGHARHYVDPDPGVRNWTMFMAYDEETQFRALEYLRERDRIAHGAEEREPFGMVVSFHHPHDPFHVRQEYWDLYRDEDIATPEYPDDLESTYSAMDRWANDAHETDRYDVRNRESLIHLRHAYYAALSYVDRKLGELLDVLEETGELDDTIVVFTSDHGDMLGERGMVQKRAFYEWSVRVPLLVRLPGAQRAGSVVEEPVSLVDVLPTVLDLVAYPEESRAPLDGRSLVGLMDGKADGDAPAPVFSEYHLEKVHAPCFMVRDGRYKYIYIHGFDEQLFDLESDPDEWDDLSGRPEYEEQVARLRGLIVDRFDPERLRALGADSIRRRVIVRDAMRINDTHWDYEPRTDSTTQYVR